jgi:hypothetical protein
MNLEDALNMSPGSEAGNITDDDVYIIFPLA